MRPSRTRAVFIGLAVVLAPTALAGQSSDTGTVLRDQQSTVEAARFLLVPLGARSAGLAGATTASRGDLEGVLWNPASAADPGSSVAYFHAANDFGTSSQVLGFLWSWNRARLGLAYLHFDMGTIDARDAANQSLGSIELDDDALIVTAAYRLTPDLDLGINYKLVRLASACSGDCDGFDQRSLGHAFDVGAVGEFSSLRGLRVGGVLRNLGPDVRFGSSGTSDPMPARLRVGAAIDVGRAWLPETAGFGFVLQGDVQQTVFEFDDLDGYLGAEVSLRDLLFVRGGYAWASVGRTGPSLGIGLRYSRLVVDLGRRFDDFAGFDSDSPFLLSLAFRF